MFNKASKSIRLFFLISSIVITIIMVIASTYQLQWLNYVIPGLFLIVAITGICPSLNISRKIMGET